MSLRDQIHPKELGQRERIDRIGLHLGRSDGLELPGMSELELDAVLPQEIGDPVPAPGGLHHSAVRALESVKIAKEIARASRHLGPLEERALGIERGNGQGPLVKIDAVLEHGTSEKM